MTQQLGELFLQAAIDPVHGAGRRIMARDVAGGLQELASANLEAALADGIKRVAQATGLPDNHIRGMLPRDQLDALIVRLRASQASSAEQWTVHTGHIGGLLVGVAELTIDGRPPDTALSLSRLSRKMQLDRALAVPLHQLSVDLDEWTALLEACKAYIDDGKALRGAYRRRRLLMAGVGATVMTIIAITTFWFVRIYQSRARLEWVIAQADPCACASADQSDVDRASHSLREQLEARMKLCEMARAKAKQEEQERALAIESAEAEKAKRQLLEAGCEVLIQNATAGALTEADQKLAGKWAPLMSRIGANQLRPEDVASDVSGLPCANAKTFGPLAAAFARAALTSSASWVNVHVMSESAANLIVKAEPHLEDRKKQIFAAMAEQVAKGAVLMGDADQVDRAKRLCAVAISLKQAPKANCRVMQAHEAPLDLDL